MNMSDFLAGLSHPIGGADHILAMVAIGLWGAMAGGRALWAWPAAFVTMVLVGFAAATSGVQTPLVEPAIASSIVVLGLLIALAVRAPVWLGAVIAGLFAFFHGHAHGTEAMAAGGSPLCMRRGFARDRGAPCRRPWSRSSSRPFGRAGAAAYHRRARRDRRFGCDGRAHMMPVCRLDAALSRSSRQSMKARSAG